MSSVEGLDELLATLSGLGGDIKESSRKGLERGAKKIQKNAKYLCPVRKPTKTKVKTKNGKTKRNKEGKVVWKAKNGGQLRNSIKTKSEVTIDGVEAQVYTDAEYAPYVEFGTGQRGKESNIDRPDGISYKADWKGQTAQPYLTPAYLHAKNTGEVEQEVIKSIEQDIRKLGSGKK